MQKRKLGTQINCISKKETVSNGLITWALKMKKIFSKIKDVCGDYHEKMLEFYHPIKLRIFYRSLNLWFKTYLCIFPSRKNFFQMKFDIEFLIKFSSKVFTEILIETSFLLMKVIESPSNLLISHQINGILKYLLKISMILGNLDYFYDLIENSNEEIKLLLNSFLSENKQIFMREMNSCFENEENAFFQYQIYICYLKLINLFSKNGKKFDLILIKFIKKRNLQKIISGI